MANEIPVIFECHADKLLGIIHQPERSPNVGVLLVVGGPQYRVGSHRQFVLLARMLASNGIAVMRFDYRGMGDAEGSNRSFASVDGDIAAAISAFYQSCPTLSGVVIWGLCDAASAALFYAYQDERVKGLIILNPWVFTEQGAAKTYLKHYYLKRIFNRELWSKIFSLQFDYRQSLASLSKIVTRLINDYFADKRHIGVSNEAQTDKVDATLDLPARMRECLRRFSYPVLLILSGRDLTADEFRETIKSDAEWQTLLQHKRITHYNFDEADHTFSSHAWRNQVEGWTLAWLEELTLNRLSID